MIEDCNVVESHHLYIASVDNTQNIRNIFMAYNFYATHNAFTLRKN